MDVVARYELDHVVLLLPYAYLSNPPTWLSSNFTLTPGGRHGDNKTENRLILFKDGTYIELIAFIDDSPQHREGHWWDKPFGVVDYAFTTAKWDYDELTARLDASNTGISYNPPKEGGRKRPDGVELIWEVCFPKAEKRGFVPFFCMDRTPRDRRVPLSEESTTHACGAVGIAGIVAAYEKEQLKRYEKATAAVLGSEVAGDGRYEARTPNEVKGLKKPTIRLREREQGEEKELVLSLVLQTGEQGGQKDIVEDVDGGRVAILFEYCPSGLKNKL